MGMTTVVRRAASRVVPLAARAFQANPGSNYHSSALSATVNRLRTTDLANVLFKPSFPSTLRSFSSQPGPDKPFLKRILRIIRSEIHSVEEEEEDVPGDFPFKIEEGKQNVTLTREYKDEQITVEVHMLVSVDNYNDNEVDGDDKKREPFALDLVVRISKKEGLCLEFACTAVADEIFIRRLSVKNPNSTEDQIIACEGPAELNENLHNRFCTYLELRGIKASVANILHEYMLNKDRREYVGWLKNVKKFMEA